PAHPRQDLRRRTPLVKFTTKLFQGKSKNVTGIVIPPEIIERLGGGKRAPVKVTLNGYTYRNTVAVMGGKFMLGVAAEHREKAGVKGGDTIEVRLELETDPREVSVPADLAAALKIAEARDAFDALAYTYRKEHVRSIEEAKAPETTPPSRRESRAERARREGLAVRGRARHVQG